MGHRSFSRRRARAARLLIGLGIVGALVGSTPGLAAAVPPPPPNPSDSDIAQAQTQVSAGLGQVSELINQVASADQQLAQLDNEVAIKREDVNRALVDLQNARSAADLAASVVGASQQALRDAGAQIELAQKDFDKYARSSYTQGTNVSAISTYLGAQGPGDVLDRAQVLKLLATSQNAVLEGLQRARTAQANKDSAAREAKQQADVAADQAASKKSLAEQAIAIARSALQDQAAKKAQIESNRAAAQAQLDAARGNVGGPPIVGAVHLDNVCRDLARERRRAGLLERPGRDDYLVGLDAPVFDLDNEAAIAPGQRAHRAVELDRELELGRVPLEVGDHFIPRRVAVGVAGEGQAGQAAVAARREERERVPASPPSRTGRLVGLEDHERPPVLRQEATDCQSSLAGADDDRVEKAIRPRLVHLGSFRLRVSADLSGRIGQRQRSFGW